MSLPPKPPPPKFKPLRKPKGATETDEATRLTRTRGALLGLAIGEALGIPFAGRHIPAADYPNFNDVPRDITGGGPHSLKPGQTSWVTQMAVVMANHLSRRRVYSVEKIAKEYLGWSPNALELPDTIKQALEMIADNKHPEHTGYRVWLNNGQKPKDNSPMSRIVPLAIFYAKSRDERFKAILQDVRITHFSPQVTLACLTYGGVIAHAVLTPAPKLLPAELIKVAESELTYAASELGRIDPNWAQMIRDSADWLREDLRLAQANDPQLYGPDIHLFLHTNWVRLSFRMIFWQAMHAPAAETALLDVVNRGADAATNAALTGALMGAIHGEKAFPSEWQEPVLEVLGHMAGIMWDVYHPRLFLDFAAVKRGDQPPMSEEE